MRIVLTILLVMALGAARAWAADNDLPYSYYRLEERIAVAAQDGLKGGLLIKGGVQVLDYREIEYFDRTAMVTLAGRKPVVLAALLYTKSAVYVINPGLLLPSDHEVTLTAELPVTMSLLRVLVFDRMPDSRTLANFAAKPATTSSQYMLGDMWLRTDIAVTPQAGALFPWEDTFGFFPRLTGTRTHWPYLLARLDSSGYVHAKDCCVTYSGLTTMENGEHGPIGAWPLEISESMHVHFYVPSRLNYRRAILVLRSLPAGSEYDLRLNGFAVTVLPDENGVPVSPGVDIRSYLRSGQNELELRAPTFGQGGRLTRLELWLD